MTITHETINTILLIIIGAIIFNQRETIKSLRTILEMLDIQKIKDAHEYIEKGNQHKFNLLMTKHIDTILKTTSKRVQEVNKDFYESFNELINIPFSIMKDKSKAEREKHLKNYPKSESLLRQYLTAYDRGEFDDFIRDKTQT